MNRMRGSTASSTSGKTLAEENGRVKLLLVDDDPANLLALQAILEPLEQELMLAQNGTDALRLCLEHDFAAILLDVRMPGMDGFETAEMIRARKKSLQTPILFVTAYRSDEQLFRGYNLGAVDFLFKPIVPEILQSKVNVFVELRRTEQALRRKAEELARTEERFRVVLEAAPDAMVITNHAGTIEMANSSADSLFGRSREALIGRDIHSLLPQWLLLPPVRMGLPRRSPTATNHRVPRRWFAIPGRDHPQFLRYTGRFADYDRDPRRYRSGRCGSQDPKDKPRTGKESRRANGCTALFQRGFTAVRLGRQP